MTCGMGVSCGSRHGGEKSLLVGASLLAMGYLPRCYSASLACRHQGGSHLLLRWFVTAMEAPQQGAFQTSKKNLRHEAEVSGYLVDRGGRATARDQAAASLSFFSGRTLTLTDAGLAANQRSSPVNGSLPLRFGLAATATEVILSRPGSVNVPAPFL